MLETPATTSQTGFYRAGLMSPEHRRFVTVGRSNLLTDVLEALKKNAGRSAKHHSLFIGLRGIGKTHLLSLIEDEIASDPQLSEHYLVVRFPEESLRTLSFADFLLGMVEILAGIRPEEPGWAALLQGMRGEEDDAKIVDAIVPAIRKANQQHKRTLVIMLENMGEIFTRQIRDKREIGALRKFLMESKNDCLLIGTATMNFDGLTSVDEPFYDFFDVQHLDHLTEEESTALVHRGLEWAKRDDLLAQWDELYPKLIALYRMTGGNPRLTVMLSDLISKDLVVEVRDQFRRLLDQITPFFQDRLNNLGAQERALLETMATMRDTEKTPGSIGERMRKKVTHISTLLKRLSELRLVTSSSHPNDKRVRLYNISEGFFDLWLYMNNSRGARERLPFLLDFFASFYPSYMERERKRAELLGKSSKADVQANALAALDTLSELGTAPEKARSKVFLANAYMCSGHDNDGHAVLREAVAQPLDRMGSWIMRSAASEPYPDYLTEMQELISLWDEHRSGNLETFVRKMREMGDAFTPFAYSKAKLAFLEAHLEEVPPGEDRVLLRLKIGSIYKELAYWRESEMQGRLASEEAETKAPSLLSWALNDYAHLLQATSRLKEAEPLMRRALAIDEQNFGSDHPIVAINLNNLATLLQVTNRLTEAEPLMRRALAIDEQSYGPDHPTAARDINNLATLLQVTNRLTEAEPLMRRALAIDEQSYGP
ncbi:MAG: tetratricopeptide repeat protein, partial [Verrucomicrobiaceae bacterium]